MRAIGFFGGTFDPVHFGHLRTALELHSELPFDEVRFTPCGVPPHGKAPLASAGLRLGMLRAALDGQPGFVIDDSEVNKPTPAYTVESLEALRAARPDVPLCMIVGLDAFLGIESWHRSEELLDLAHVIVVRRPGSALPATGRAGELIAGRGAGVEAIEASPAGAVIERTVTQLEISSSAIRATVRAGRSPRYLVPDAVAAIIESSGCYAA